jgi:hypothetical protein
MNSVRCNVIIAYPNPSCSEQKGNAAEVAISLTLDKHRMTRSHMQALAATSKGSGNLMPKSVH